MAVPFGQDGDFGQRALIDRINNDLGNDLGNLLNRLIGMSYKYFDGVIVSGQCEKYYSEELKRIQTVIGELEANYFELKQGNSRRACTTFTISMQVAVTR